MKKMTFVKVAATASVLLGLPMFATTAFAATASFDTQYQANATQEATLWQEVQSSSVTDADIQALENTVTNINTQTTTLYNALQALNNGVSSIPQGNVSADGQLRELQGKRLEMIKANNAAWASVVFDLKHHQLAAARNAQAQHNYWSNQLKLANEKIKSLATKDDIVLGAYDGARPALETSILDLQKSSIGYTNEIIALQSGSTTGSTYDANQSTSSLSNNVNVSF